MYSGAPWNQGGTAFDDAVHWFRYGICGNKPGGGVPQSARRGGGGCGRKRSRNLLGPLGQCVSAGQGRFDVDVSRRARTARRLFALVPSLSADQSKITIPRSVNN